MLHFVYGPGAIGCLVNHSYSEGRFVLHVPYSRIEKEQLEKSVYVNRVEKIVLSALGASPGTIRVQVVDWRFWSLSAAHAEHFHCGKAVLCGDSGHSVPPAGGFGLNLGIADAHSLAHKLKTLLLLRGPPGSFNQACLDQVLQPVNGFSNPRAWLERMAEAYGEERTQAAAFYVALSLKIFKQNLGVARDLHLDMDNLKALESLAAPLPVALQRGLFRVARAVAPLSLRLFDPQIQPQHLIALCHREEEDKLTLALGLEHPRLAPCTLQGRFLPHFSAQGAVAGVKQQCFSRKFLAEVLQNSGKPFLALGSLSVNSPFCTVLTEREEGVFADESKQNWLELTSSPLQAELAEGHTLLVRGDGIVFARLRPQL